MDTNKLLLSVSIGLICSHVFTYLCHDNIKLYEKDLTDDLLLKYKYIRNERMSHFNLGLLMALIISVIYNIKNTELSLYSKIIHTSFIILLTPLVIYKILPKTDYMLQYSQNPEQIKDWFNIYLCMQNKYIYGFLCGFTISIIILYFI